MHILCKQWAYVCMPGLQEVNLKPKTHIFYIEIIKRGEWDLNPRVLTNMGLAIPRPTGLGDPRPTAVKVKDSIGLY
jgi:hypothetical protein